MSRRIATVRPLLTALALLPLAACAELDPNDLISGIYFIKLEAEPAQVADMVQTMADDNGLEPLHVYDSASEGFTVRMLHDLAPEIEKLDGVEYVRQDEQQDLVPPEEVGEPIDVGADEIPEGIARAGGPYPTVLDWSGVQVAVIDTGVDSSHPDLNVVSGNDADMVCQSNSNDCAKGGDPQGHGTHVAGTIGAIADGNGVVGMAPGVPIHAVRVLGKDGSGYVSDILAGIEYVLDHPEIKVANMSLGGPAGSSLDAELDEALRRLEDAGVVVAIAAGNENQDTKNVVPAGLDRGIVVSAYDASGGSDNGWAWFSNYGDAVDVAAPGVAITSTWPGGEYAVLDGTSMATPHVAGAAAVYLALHPNAGPNAVRSAIIDSSADVSGQNGRHSEGMLDLEALAD